MEEEHDRWIPRKYFTVTIARKYFNQRMNKDAGSRRNKNKAKMNVFENGEYETQGKKRSRKTDAPRKMRKRGSTRSSVASEALPDSRMLIKVNHVSKQTLSGDSSSWRQIEFPFLPAD
ncbi:hypothetical protein KM043_007518 [Ampulex compressa]|nr:hypothetical protein KM043_007518 [Ampulex compressa]